MPVYDVSAVAHALDLEPKQLDNLLSRNTVHGLEKRRRGVARRLTPGVVVAIRLAKELSGALDVSLGSLLPIASQLERDGRREVALGAFASLQIDLDGLRSSTLARLDGAVEVVGRRRRGRPPKQPMGEHHGR